MVVKQEDRRYIVDRGGVRDLKTQKEPKLNTFPPAAPDLTVEQALGELQRLMENPDKLQE